MKMKPSGFNKGSKSKGSIASPAKTGSTGAVNSVKMFSAGLKGKK